MPRGAPEGESRQDRPEQLGETRLEGTALRTGNSVLTAERIAEQKCPALPERVHDDGGVVVVIALKQFRKLVPLECAIQRAKRVLAILVLSRLLPLETARGVYNRGAKIERTDHRLAEEAVEVGAEHVGELPHALALHVGAEKRRCTRGDQPAAVPNVFAHLLGYVGGESLHGGHDHHLISAQPALPDLVFGYKVVRHAK